MSKYSNKFKGSMVKKLTTGDAISAGAMSIEEGVPQSTLSRWVREYGTVGSGGNGMKKRRPQDWSAEEKLDAVLEYERLEEEQRGQYLREKGLHAVHLERWKKTIIEGLKASKPNKQDPQKKKIKELEKELRRKDKALAETAALLVLKKKAQEIWGEPEDER
jgi:transposase-like protein